MRGGMSRSELNYHELFYYYCGSFFFSISCLHRQVICFVFLFYTMNLVHILKLFSNIIKCLLAFTVSGGVVYFSLLLHIISHTISTNISFGRKVKTICEVLRPLIHIDVCYPRLSQHIPFQDLILNVHMCIRYSNLIVEFDFVSQTTSDREIWCVLFYDDVCLR